jgi:hypothetical protein
MKRFNPYILLLPVIALSVAYFIWFDVSVYPSKPVVSPIHEIAVK